MLWTFKKIKGEEGPDWSFVTLSWLLNLDLHDYFYIWLVTLHKNCSLQENDWVKMSSASLQWEMEETGIVFAEQLGFGKIVPSSYIGRDMLLLPVSRTNTVTNGFWIFVHCAVLLTLSFFFLLSQKPVIAYLKRNRSFYKKYFIGELHFMFGRISNIV